MPEYNITDNRDAARTSETDHLWTAPYSLDGSGMLIGEWDGGGVRTTHQEFGGRVTQVDGPSINIVSLHTCCRNIDCIGRSI